MKKVDIPIFFYNLALYLYSREPLVSVFLLNVNYIIDEDGEYLKDGVVGVISRSDKTYFIFKSKIFFIYSKEELFFIVLHEAEHVFKKHIEINKKIFNENPLVANVAEDCVINSELKKISYNGLQPKFPYGVFFVPTTYKIENRQQEKLGYSSQDIFHWLTNKNKEFNNSISEKSNMSFNFNFEVQEREGKFPDFFQATIKNGSLVIKKPNGKEVYNNIEDFDKNYIMYLNPNDLRIGIEHKWLKSGYFKEKHFIDEEEDEFFKTNETNNDKKISAKRMVEIAEELSSTNGKSGKSQYLLTVKQKVNSLGIDWRKELNKNINIFISKNKSTKKIIQSYFSWIKNPRSYYGIMSKGDKLEKIKNSPTIFVGIDTSATIACEQEFLSSIFSELKRIHDLLSFNLKGRVIVFQWAEKVLDIPREFSNDIEIIGGGGTNPDCFLSIFKKERDSYHVEYVSKEKKVQRYYFEKETPPLVILITDGIFKKSSLSNIGIYEEHKENLIIVSKNKNSIRGDLRCIII